MVGKPSIVFLPACVISYVPVETAPSTGCVAIFTISAASSPPDSATRYCPCGITSTVATAPFSKCSTTRTVCTPENAETIEETAAKAGEGSASAGTAPARARLKHIATNPRILSTPSHGCTNIPPQRARATPPRPQKRPQNQPIEPHETKLLGKRVILSVILSGARLRAKSKDTRG